MDTRALKRLLLLVGVPIMIAAVILMRRVRAESAAMEYLLIALLALGAFLAISGLVGTLTEPPVPDDAFDDASPLSRAGDTLPPRPPAVAAAMGMYVVLLAIVAGIIVGVAQGDAGVGIQTFTFGIILGGIIFGVGYLLGHRPAAEE